MITEPAKAFTRMFRGYDPAAVDAHIEMLTTKQQLLLDDVESLRTRLKAAGDETAALRKEVAVLTDTSPSPHAMQRRMAKMLKRAVDEVSEMQAEARSEADALIAAAEAEVEAAQRKHEEELAKMAAQRKAMETDYDETKKQLEAELAGMRAKTEVAIDEAWRDAQEADHYREQARRAADEAIRQRINVLEQLMGVYRDLEAVPAALESAYQEQKDAPEPSVVVPLDGKVSTGEPVDRPAASPPGVVAPDRYLGAVSIRTHRLSAAQARRIAVAAQGFSEPRPAGPITRAHLKRLISNPSAATGFGVSRGTRPLRAGIQPARSLRPRRAGPRRLGAAFVASAGRVLGARGRAGGRRRLAAAALADAPVPSWRLGHPHRQGQSPTRRGHRRRRRRTRPQHCRADRSAPGRRAAQEKGNLVEPQRHQVGRRGAVCLRRAHHGHPGGLRPPLRPGGAGAAGRACWRARSTTRRPCGNSRWGGHRPGRGHRGRHSRLLPGVVMLIPCSPCVNAGY